MKRLLIKSQGLNRLAIVIAFIYTIIPLFFGNHDFSIGTFVFEGEFDFDPYWHTESYMFSILIIGATVNFIVCYLLFKIYEWIKEGFKK